MFWLPKIERKKYNAAFSNSVFIKLKTMTINKTKSRINKSEGGKTIYLSLVKFEFLVEMKMIETVFNLICSNDVMKLKVKVEGSVVVVDQVKV